MVGMGEDEMEQDMHWRVSGVPPRRDLREPGAGRIELLRGQLCYYALSTLAETETVLYPEWREVILILMVWFSFEMQ